MMSASSQPEASLRKKLHRLVGSRPIDQWLIALVLVTLLPLAALSLLVFGRFALDERARAQRQLIETTRALALATESHAQSAVRRLEALAATRALATADLPRFKDSASRAIANGEFTELGLFSPSGHLLAGEGIPAVTPSSESAVADILRVAQTRRPFISDFTVSPLTGRPAVVLAVPVIQKDQVIAVLVGIPDLPHELLTLMREQGLPKEVGGGAIMDRRGVYIARTLNPETAVGQQASAEYRRHAVASTEGIVRNVNPEGQAVYGTFVHTSFGWITGIGVPASRIEGPFWRAIMTLGGLWLGGLIVCVGLAAIGGRRIAAALGRLATAASETATNRIPTPRREAIAEVDLTRRALIEAAEQRDQLLREHARARDMAEAARAEAESVRDELAHRVAGLTLLAQVSTRLVPKGNLQPLLLDILDAAIKITRADMGNMQLRDRHTGHLQIVAQRGFEAEFLEFFATVHDDTAACGTAMRTRQRIIVENVATDALFTGTEAGGVLDRAGVRAVQSTPLWSRAGDIVGMLSTHYRRAHRPDERDLQLLDIIARLAADYIVRLRVEDEAEAARARAERADRAKDEFLAMLSHELRNPLGAIASAVGVLNATKDHEVVTRAQAVIGRQVQHLSRLVDDLLDVSRVTAGKIALSLQPIDLADLVRNITTVWRSSGRLDRHEIALESEPVWINADEVRMEQVVTNIVGNALKYTPAGGRIAIRVGAERDVAVLEVTDTGVGIRRDLLETIFDIFVQGQQPLDRAQGGLGLGLALAKSLVEMHHGRIEAVSDGPGRGARFTIRLPHVTAPAPTGRTPSGRPDVPATASMQRILVVEDNDDQREMLGTALRQAGHQVQTAADGPTGVELSEELHPDVVLIDVGLPGLDGYEVARRIRATAHGRSIRIIAITGYGQADDVARALEVGFDAHLTKPVMIDRLAAIIAAP